MEKSALLLASVLLSAIISGSEVACQERELGQVLVTATKTPILAEEVPQSISVIGEKDIAFSGKATLADVLRDGAGLDIKTVGPRGSAATLSIWGSEPEQVLVLIDGRRINDAQAGEFNLSDLPIPVEEIERVEVLRGAGSALYGTDAVGGVVNIITKRPTEKPLTTLSGSLARFNTQRFYLANGQKFGRVGYRLHALKERSDGHRENSDYEGTALGGMLTLEPMDELELSFSVRHLLKEMGTPGSVSLPDPDDRQEDRKTLADLTLEWSPLDPLELRLKGFHNNYRREFTENPARDISIHRNFAYGGELQLGYLLTEKDSLTGGLELIEDRLESNRVGTHNATRVGYYLEGKFEPIAPATFVLGGRFDHHSIYGDQFNPRVGLRLRVSEQTALRVSAGRSFRGPTFDDLYWPASAYAEGNPDLSPERAWSYQAGIDQAFGKRVSAKFTGFRRDIKDFIDWAAGSDGIWRPENIGRARIWGIEGELEARLPGGFTLPLSYTYLHPKDKRTGDYITEKPKHIFNAALTYEGLWGLRGRIKGRYIKNYLTDGNGNRSYFVTDIRISKGLKLTKGLEGEVFIAGNNIFDRKYESLRGYPMPRREFSGGVALKF